MALHLSGRKGAGEGCTGSFARRGPTESAILNFDDGTANWQPRPAQRMLGIFLLRRFRSHPQAELSADYLPSSFWNTSRSLKETYGCFGSGSAGRETLPRYASSITT
jgi:hypothetical protein